MGKERIAKVNPDDIGAPKGAYRVELTDRHTGKVLERIEAENYLTPLLTRTVAWYQAAATQGTQRWVHKGGASHYWPYATNADFDEADRLSYHDYSMPPNMGYDTIVGTDSLAPIDTADTWGRGQVVGYATKWKSGIPAAGRRGLINETQSELTLDSIKTVFDFNENQGNGTINSLMMSRISQYDELAYDAASLMLPVDQHVGYGRFAPIDWPAVGAGNGTSAGGYDDTGFYFWDNTKEIYHFEPADYTTDAWGAIVPGAAPTVIDCTTIGPTLTSFASTGPDFSNIDVPSKLCRDGTNWIHVYTDGVGNLNVGSYTADGLTRNFRTEVQSSGFGTENNSVYPVGVTAVGGKIWVTAKSQTPSTYFPADLDVNRTIYRVDIATGLVDGKIVLPLDLDGNAIIHAREDSSDIRAHNSLATDGTDIYVGSSLGILRVSTAGAVLDHLGDPYSIGGTSGFRETGIAPWSTATDQQIHEWRQQPRENLLRMDYFRTDLSDGWNGYYRTNNPSTTELGYAKTGLGIIGGKLFVTKSNGGTINGSSAWLAAYSTGGNNMMSRTLLDTAIVKTSSSTMKWTYELTLPSEWRDMGSHLPIPTVLS